MVGGLIMAHGDDDGLVVPPALAPIQAVVLVVKDEGARASGWRRWPASCRPPGSAPGSTTTSVRPRPARHRLGAEGGTGAGGDRPRRPGHGRRDAGPARHRNQGAGATGGAGGWVEKLVADVQQDILTDARSRRDANIADASDIREAAEASRSGFAAAVAAGAG